MPKSLVSPWGLPVEVSRIYYPHLGNLTKEMLAVTHPCVAAQSLDATLQSFEHLFKYAFLTQTFIYVPSFYSHFCYSKFKLGGSMF